MYRDHGWYGGGHPVFGWIVMLLFLASLVVLVVAAVRWLLGDRRPPSAFASSWPSGSSDDALGIARTRYARGEIDRDAFLRISEDLSAPQRPHGAAPSYPDPAVVRG
jgi:putative membrane protein